MNSVVVTVVYLLQALHQRIVVCRILLYKMQRIRASLDTAIYDNKLSNCLVSRSQRLIGCACDAFGVSYRVVASRFDVIAGWFGGAGCGVFIDSLDDEVASR